jgi:hypothetical protein
MSKNTKKTVIDYSKLDQEKYGHLTKDSIKVLDDLYSKRTIYPDYNAYISFRATDVQKQHLHHIGEKLSRRFHKKFNRAEVLRYLIDSNHELMK